MSISPIDLQVLIPKSSEVSKIKTNESERYNHEQQHTVATLKQKAEQNLKRIISTEKPYKAKVTEKNKEENSSNKRNRKGKDTHVNETVKENHSDRGDNLSERKTIDILI